MTRIVYTLGILFLLIQHIQAAKVQLPFLTHPREQSTLQLKSIYHHASAHGPIPRLFRKTNVNNEMFSMNEQQQFTLKSKYSVIHKPAEADITDLLASKDPEHGVYARWSNLNTMRAMYMESTIGKIPDVTDRPTVLTLAMMTNNAYLDINLNNTEWYDLGEPWQLVKVSRSNKGFKCVLI
jgi:lipase ATG15